MTLPAPRPDAGPRAAPPTFLRAEDGSLTILGVFMFILMLVAGGVALDAMRAERQRTALQTTIDRGVLAATSLDQERPGDAVMRDYLRAADIPADAVRIEAFDNGAERSLAVDTVATTPSLFMNALGIDELRQPIRSSAIEVRTELELSLVVDISGSMADGDGQKIVRLRQAASEFVGKLLQGREERTTISLVPYGEVVTFGPVVGRYFPFSTDHARSFCPTFENDAYLRLDLPGSGVIQRLAHFDRATSGNTLGPIARPLCPITTKDAILPWSNNVVELQRRIETLPADGTSTAINLGAKVGTLLLDPSARPRLQAMIGDTALPSALRVDPVFVDRPVDYGTVGTHKVMVVMSDGANNELYDLNPAYRTGPSTIWLWRERTHSCDNSGDPTGCSDYVAGNPDAANYPFGTTRNPDSSSGTGAGPYQSRYSFSTPGRDDYYVHSTTSYRATPLGGDEAIQISWPDIYDNASISWIINNLVSKADADTKAFYASLLVKTHVNTSKKRSDVNLSDICRTARDQGVLIYTIAFKADAGGRKALRDCAGADHPDRYFEISSLDIDSAFDEILAAVSRLRLTR